MMVLYAHGGSCKLVLFGTIMVVILLIWVTKVDAVHYYAKGDKCTSYSHISPASASSDICCCVVFRCILFVLRCALRDIVVATPTFIAMHGLKKQTINTQQTQHRNFTYEAMLELYNVRV
jgi:hypothetical protein